MTSRGPKFQRIFEAWTTETAKNNETPWFKRIATGQLSLSHYLGYLQETFHYTGINPQIQAYCTLFLKSAKPNLVGRFLKHANSEVSHDELALADLEVLGVPQEVVRSSQPLPITLAMNGFITHYIQFRNPLGYLGYLFHLEFLPTQNGDAYIQKLRAMGVPDKAMSFLIEHAAVDVAHNKLMEGYIEELIQTEADLQDVIYATKATCNLHGLLISAAFENGERCYKNMDKKAA